MKFRAILVVTIAMLGCTRKEAPKAPFALAVVPTHGIAMCLDTTMSRDVRNEFYVVLTNISDRPQAVWEEWNSWGYQNISFEFTTSDGRKYVISKREEDFTRNFPSTLLIQPGEHQVYSIWLDKWWEAHPSFPKGDEMPIKMKAVYEVEATPEGVKAKVWTGRLESKTYSFMLRQW